MDLGGILEFVALMGGMLRVLEAFGAATEAFLKVLIDRLGGGKGESQRSSPG